MNRFATAVVATIIGAGTATAGGLDRSGQNINILFEEGTYAELSFGYVAPTVDGNDLAAFRGQATGDVAGNFIRAGLGYKQQINDQLSFALIVDQPYGADIAYAPGVPGVGGSLTLGGTRATLNATALTGLVRYEFTDRFSVHGGIRAQTINAAVDLRGGGYGPLGTYSVTLDGDTAFGFQVGGAYEIPEIALRLAVTYFSEIDHEFQSVETGLTPVAVNGITEVTTPEAINIDFQTGIAKDTLAFASFRYADYGVVRVSPPVFNGATGGASLTNIDTARDLSIGVGRRFSDQLSASVALNFSDGGSDNLVSPLGPTDGSIGITLAGSYQVTDQIKLSGGINYTKFGDSIPTVGGNQLANIDDNSAVGVGFRIGYSF
ncbi:OmpP1/FadL family transporter [Jannaschia pohangensis]|uniref:Long-chain fatty acid transport protein n=1 Tax=Jannaschia pohangensis TaxID=390807 RepID=A0A1I3HVH8_9RHOB|nr:outer membrane protein transport protein [Jannaschia pohangensis]SFI39691.1 Long-chain fatty acid transport protein [Jannaschia pohangensis]